MASSEKRTIQVNVKMSSRDLVTLKRAAHRLWPEAIISNSGIVLGLAKLAAKEAMKSPNKSD